MRGGRIAAGTALVATLGGAAWLWASLAGPPTPAMPTEAERAAMLDFVQAVVNGSATAPPGRRCDVSFVIVSGYRPGKGPVSGKADVGGCDVAEALRTVAVAMRSQAPAWSQVRIDLAGTPKPIPGRGPGVLAWWLDPGIDGLVAADGSYAGPSARVEEGGSVRAVAQRLGPGALSRFRAASFVRGAVLRRGNVLPTHPPTAASLRAAAIAGGSYLARNQDPEGRFVYKYDASDDEDEGGYNLLRHCGTAMALFQVHAVSGDAAHRDAGLRALQYVRERYVLEVDEHPGAVFLREGRSTRRGEVKLGALGLGVLAWLAAADAGVELGPEDRALVRGLGQGIVAMQRPSGELASYLAYGDDPGSSRRSTYYPGEAMLALSRLSRWTGDASYLDVARRAADFQLGRWTWGGIEIQVPPDAWGAQALEEIYAAFHDPRHATYAFRIGDELLRTTFPRGADVPPDLVGATFDLTRLVRTGPTSARNEAVVAVARLARAMGERERSARYLAAATDAAWFGISQQVRPENSFLFRDPQQAMGGVRDSIVDGSIRIDGVQHSISGWLGLAALLESP